MKWRGIFIGLNYSHCPSGKLRGCINDTKALSKVFKDYLGNGTVTLHTDDKDLKSTSHNGIITLLNNLVAETNKEKYELVVIHYSGHGSYIKDTNYDEQDKRDEVICPSDYLDAGMISDDILNYIIRGITVETKVIAIFDSCHSGSILDLQYRWNIETKTSIIESNNNIIPKVILISGCKDDQTSADSKNRITLQPQGALTSALVNLLGRNPILSKNVFELVKAINSQLKYTYTQIPQLSSNFNLVENPLFFNTEI